MREELVGYLTGALEPDEACELEARLAAEESLRRELEELRQLLGPLLADRTPTQECMIDPPQGLADRVCEKVWYLRSAESAAISQGGLTRPESVALPVF